VGNHRAIDPKPTSCGRCRGSAKGVEGGPTESQLEVALVDMPGLDAIELLEAAAQSGRRYENGDATAQRLGSQGASCASSRNRSGERGVSAARYNHAFCLCHLQMSLGSAAGGRGALAICLMKNLGGEVDTNRAGQREAQARSASGARPDHNPNSVAAEERPV
jgi:hypothetical protein